MSSSAPPMLSVAVPVYCEEAVIEEFHRRLVAALDGAERIESWEVVYADDGSSDGTPGILDKLASGDERVRVVRLSRNFGHQAAITAAMDHARGRGIVVIDADLQDPPEVIPQMVDRWLEGYDVVYGQRTHRAGESAFKKTTASVFYRLIDWMAEVDLPRDAADFRLIDRRVAEALSTMPERSRYVRGMVAWVGFRQTGLPYERDARFAGETKYPVRKMVKFAIDAATSFSDKPLRLATRVGLLMLFMAFAVATYLVVDHFFLDSVTTQGWVSLMLTILVFGGVQLLTVGVLGEYVGRIYKEVQHRPVYIVASVTEPPAAA